MRRRVLVLTALLAVFVGAARTPAQAAPVTVFAAASLRESLGAAGQAFTKETGVPVTFSFAGSNAVARQVSQGAPADVVVTADAEWMDWMAARRLIDARSRRTILRNRLVLAAPADSKVRLSLRPGVRLSAALGQGRLAVADPAVPAGRYGVAALKSLGAWSGVQSRLAPAADVRGALAYVARGEAPLGIVYATDARIEPRVRVVDVFPERSHPPVVYPAARVAASRNRDADAFLRFLQSPAGRAVFERYGFIPVR
jgi:molybdate transport system substrate-binding protein